MEQHEIQHADIIVVHIIEHEDRVIIVSKENRIIEVQE